MNEFFYERRNWVGPLTWLIGTVADATFTVTVESWPPGLLSLGGLLLGIVFAQSDWAARRGRLGNRAVTEDDRCTNGYPANWASGTDPDWTQMHQCLLLYGHEGCCKFSADTELPPEGEQ